MPLAITCNIYWFSQLSHTQALKHLSMMVNFTFVSHKGARPEKSELVKSHVMRESQKKRREAKQNYRRMYIFDFSYYVQDCRLTGSEAPPFGEQSTTSRTESTRQYESLLSQPFHTHATPSCGNRKEQAEPKLSSSNGPREQVHPCKSPERTMLGKAQCHGRSSPNEVESNTQLHTNIQRVESPMYNVSSPSTILRNASTPFRHTAEPGDSSWMPEIWLNRVNEIVSHCESLGSLWSVKIPQSNNLHRLRELFRYRSHCF